MRLYKINILKIAGVYRPHLYINMQIISDKYHLHVFSKSKNGKKETICKIDGTGESPNVVRMIDIDNNCKKVYIDLFMDDKKIKSFKLLNIKILRIIGRIFIPIEEFIRKISNKSYDSIRTEYPSWIKRSEYFEPVKNLTYNPLISILVPIYNTDEHFLRECIESVLAQTYRNFELILVDDLSTKESPREIMREYSEKDSRIKAIFREKNGNISEATNTALSAARGEFIALLDNDDTLSPNALYENVYALNIHNGELDFLYSDEDKLDLKGRRCDPHFKPNYSPDTLMSINYITHFAVLRTEIVRKIGGERTKYNGAQDYDLFLRFVEQTSKNRIYHIPKILYHWRMSPTSTALAGSNAKNYASEAGKLALEDTLRRRNLKGKVSILNDSTVYKITYDIKKSDKISIIIPTKDNEKVLARCVDSIKKYSNKSDYEIIVVNNNSKTKEALEYYSKLSKQGIIVLTENIPFNYSRLNNIAVKNATGNYILLLNDDTEATMDGWLDIMLGFASQSHVGAVGAKLYYPNGLLQHGGVILGLGGIAGHAYKKTPYGYPGDACRLLVPYDYSAVTAACLMVKKSKYQDVGGLNEELQVAFNDVDFCLKLLRSGYNNVFLPQVELFHYESLTRGIDNKDAKKRARLSREIAYMESNWSNELSKDVYYNPNLSLKNSFHLN